VKTVLCEDYDDPKKCHCEYNGIQGGRILFFYLNNKYNN
jgi:hypothetical protein